MRHAPIACVLAAILAGCGSTAASPASPTPRAVPTTEPAAGPSEQDIQRAMTERRDFGLRADEPWVRTVAQNSNARSQLLGFPLLPAEEVEFQSRQDAYQRVTGMAMRYAAERPEQFAGLYIDQVHHLVVVKFTGDIETHRAGILALLPGGGPLDVRLAPYTKAQLEALIERITGDSDWFRTIDAAFEGGGVNEEASRVDVDISSANPAARGLIAEHFGVSPEVLHVTSDGTGIQLLPRGKVRIRVVGADGSPPGDNDDDLDWTPDRPGPGAGECGSEVGQGIPPGGRLELPCTPGGWTIAVQEATANGHRDIGSGHVVVPPGLTVDLVITLRR